MSDETAMFEARTRRMNMLLRFLGHEYGPGEGADEELQSAYNLAVQASYISVRQMALESCTNFNPLSQNDLLKDSETNPSQAAPDGPVPSE